MRSRVDELAEGSERACSATTGVLGADIVLVDDSVELLILSILSPESKRAMHSEADTSHALWPPCGPAQREVPKDSSEIGASTARRCDGRACAGPRAARKASGCCAAALQPIIDY